MLLRITCTMAAFVLCAVSAFAQKNYDKAILNIEQQIEDLAKRKIELLVEMEDLKLERLQADLKQHGLPKMDANEDIVEHSAMSLVYSEEHEQAKWVAHIITPDIIKGNAGRSNDFRPDAKVKTGSTVQEDYFLTDTLSDGTVQYDGFGFDRGHLAPSADFRWSKKALSESYLYSNMAPQRPEFNREGWGELEGMMRGYLYHHPKTQLYVCTGPVLKKGLPVIERSINKPSIPEQFFKVVVDLKNKQAIGFLMPNKRMAYPPETFAKSIDEIEELTGIDFFASLSDDLENELEKMTDVKPWMHQASKDDVLPIKATDLPANHFNTIQAKRYVGRDKKVTVCGTVVMAKYSKKGNAMLYLDKNVVDPVFIVFVRKDDFKNFEFDFKDLVGEKIMVTDKVGKIGQTPTMFLKNGKQVQEYKLMKKK